MIARSRTFRKPMGPPWHILFGQLIGWLPDKLGFFLNCAAKYGDVTDLSLGPATYLLNHPDDIKHVLVTQHIKYTKTRRLTGSGGKHLSGEGLLTSSGKEALDQRRVLQPVLSRSGMEDFARVMVKSTQEMMDAWQPGAVLDFSAEMVRLTQRIMGKTLLGVDLAQNKELARAFAVRRRYIRRAFASIIPLPAFLPTRLNRDYRKAEKTIDKTLYTLIRARRDSPVKADDMLSMLMRAQFKDGTRMSDKQVRDEALTIATTGYETIADALSWAWFLLSQNPQSMARLTAELQTVLGDRAPGIHDLPGLRYTEAVLSEAMRLYPPTWIFVRVSQEEDDLPSGIRIRAGTKLYLCPYATHRNPDYFPDPERFDPDRFSDSAVQERPAFAYFPFGGGPRVCLGQAFAMMEGVLILACIAQSYNLELIGGRDVVPEPGQTLFPKNGIWMEASLRDAAAAGDCL